MLPLLGALLRRLLLAQLAVALALGVLVLAAAWVEGHLPDPWRLRALAAGGGGALGAVWVLAAFRREGGLVALASLGRPPGLVAALALAAAVPALALAGGSPPAEARVVEHGEIRLPGGRVVWEGGVAMRTDGQAPETFPGLPPPSDAPTHRVDLLFWARLATLAAALAWLGGRAATPDVPATLAAGALATLLGLLPALVP